MSEVPLYTASPSICQTLRVVSWLCRAPLHLKVRCLTQSWAILKISSISAYNGSLFFFFTLVTGPRRFLNLKLSDTRVYEPQIRELAKVEGRKGEGLRLVTERLELDDAKCSVESTRPEQLKRGLEISSSVRLSLKWRWALN